MIPADSGEMSKLFATCLLLAPSFPLSSQGLIAMFEVPQAPQLLSVCQHCSNLIASSAADLHSLVCSSRAICTAALFSALGHSQGRALYSYTSARREGLFVKTVLSVNFVEFCSQSIQGHNSFRKNISSLFVKLDSIVMKYRTLYCM